MVDSGNSSLLGEDYSEKTYERATLNRMGKYNNKSLHSLSPHEQSKMKNDYSKLNDNNMAFWILIVSLLLVAGGNLSLTFFTMGVLRLGTGMESIEFLPGMKTTKFYGKADLGRILKNDGNIFGFEDIPFSVLGRNSEVSLSLRSKVSPQLKIQPKKIYLKNIDEFKVTHPKNGKDIFSTQYPNFNLPRGIKNLSVKKTETRRIVSPTFSDLHIRSDSMIRLKGNEGIILKGKTLGWSADQDIYMKTINGSIVLNAEEGGVHVEVNTLPLASSDEQERGRGQYKLCFCLPKGQLFRVPVPADNNRRKVEDRISCESFTNPCMKHSA